MIRSTLILLAITLLNACASTDEPKPTDIIQQGCFELPIGTHPDGSASIACSSVGTEEPNDESDPP